MLSGGDGQAQALAREGLERLSREQAQLARYLLERLEQPLDEAALELGQLLAVSVFMAFEATPDAALSASSADAVAAAEASLAADEELRRSDPMEALESEDIVAIEQPALVAFVNEQIGHTLEKHAGSIDVDHVAVVFRAILVEILALSHAVVPPAGYSPPRDAEPMA